MIARRVLPRHAGRGECGGPSRTEPRIEQ